MIDLFCGSSLVFINKLANNTIFACKVSFPLFHVFAIQPRIKRKSKVSYYTKFHTATPGMRNLQFARGQIFQLVNRLI